MKGIKKGTVVDGWTLLEKIGDGSFGEVWEVQREGQDGVFAMKIAPNTTGGKGKPSKPSDESAMLQKEHNILNSLFDKKIHVAHLAPQHSFFVGKENTHLVMDKLGVSLGEKFDALKAMTASDAAFAVYQIVSGGLPVIQTRQPRSLILTDRFLSFATCTKGGFCMGT